MAPLPLTLSLAVDAAVNGIVGVFCSRLVAWPCVAFLSFRAFVYAHNGLYAMLFPRQFSEMVYKMRVAQLLRTTGKNLVRIQWNNGGPSSRGALLTFTSAPEETLMRIVAKTNFHVIGPTNGHTIEVQYAEPWMQYAYGPYRLGAGIGLYLGAQLWYNLSRNYIAATA